MREKLDLLWDDNPIDITDEANFIWPKLRNAAGNKKNELSLEDRIKITNHYSDFEENELCKIFDNEEFMYKEYTFYQLLQKSYAITHERIEAMVQSGSLSSIYDVNKVFKLENSEKVLKLSDKEKKILEKNLKNKTEYKILIKMLKKYVSEVTYIQTVQSV